MAETPESKDLEAKTRAHERKETRITRALGELQDLLQKPNLALYDALTKMSADHIELLLKSVPTLGRDLKTVSEAMYSTLETVQQTTGYATDSLKEILGKHAHNVIDLVVANIANQRASERASGTLVRRAADAEFRAQRQAEEAKRQAEIAALIEKHNEELRVVAYTDPLTGFYNKAYFLENIANEIREANSYKTPLTMVVMDLDHYKVVNDTYGHTAGDYVLKEFGAVVRSSLLEEKPDFVVRWGGEEFVIVLTDTDEQGGTKLAERIRKNIKNHTFSHNGKQIPLTVSLGVKQYDSADTYEFFTLTDNCVYAAKHLGRDRVIAESKLKQIVRENLVGQENLQMADMWYQYYLHGPQAQSLKMPDASEEGKAP